MPCERVSRRRLERFSQLFGERAAGSARSGLLSTGALAAAWRALVSRRALDSALIRSIRAGAGRMTRPRLCHLTAARMGGVLLPRILACAVGRPMSAMRRTLARAM